MDLSPAATPLPPKPPGCAEHPPGVTSDSMKQLADILRPRDTQQALDFPLRNTGATSLVLCKRRLMYPFQSRGKNEWRGIL